MNDNEDAGLPTVEQVHAAAMAARGVVRRTPIVTSRLLTGLAGVDTRFKVEALQRGGSHKLRGAHARLEEVARTDRAAGVVTASSGNHGQAVAAAAAHHGMGCLLVMPEGSNPLKIAAARAHGAEVFTEGVDVNNREVIADQEAVARRWSRVHADDRAGVAGFGAIGLEVLEQVPDAGTVLVPVGLGALVSGIALTIKALRPQIRVVGVEPAGAADAWESFQAGRIVSLVEPPDTIADGARALSLSPRTFAAITSCVDEIVLVSDDQILRAAYLLMTRAKLVIEPTGALTFAALIESPRDWTGPVVCVLSGGNADLVDLGRRFDAAGAGWASP